MGEADRTTSRIAADPAPLLSRAEVYRAARFAASLGLVINASLATVKLLAGWYANSFALIADAVNSAGDALSSVVVVVALWYAQRPADDEHPYGHSRAESVAASNVAVLILVSAFLIAIEAVQRWTVQHDAPPAWTLWVAGLNVVIKEALYHYKRRVGRRTGSSVLAAAAWDHRADALCSLAVLMGLSVVIVGGPAWRFADDLAAIVVAVGIIIAGSKLLAESLRKSLDPQADAKLLIAARAIAHSVPHVVGIESLRIRKSGLEHFADIHVQVDPTMPVIDAHRVGHRVKDALLEAFPTLRDCLVHIEPGQPTGPAQPTTTLDPCTQSP